MWLERLLHTDEAHERCMARATAYYYEHGFAVKPEEAWLPCPRRKSA